MSSSIHLATPLVVLVVLGGQARAFIGQSTGPMYTSTPEFYGSASPSFLAVSTGQGYVSTDDVGPGAGQASSVEVNVSGTVSLTSHASTPITYDASGTVGIQLLYWDGVLSQVAYGPMHSITVPYGTPHIQFNFTETVAHWDPVGGPIYVLLTNDAQGDYIVQDGNDYWYMTWYAGNCASGYVNDSTQCIGGVVFGGRDVFAHDAGPDLTAFDLADSGGANSDSSLAADPCVTEDYRCDSASGDTALPLSRCKTSQTRIPLENSQGCPSGQTTCSCTAGDTDPNTHVAKCRMLLGTDFSSSGGPSSFKPTWADAPLTVFKDTTQLSDIKTPSDLCDIGTNYCVDYTSGSETCTIDCPQPPPPPPPPNSCKVQGLNSNQPRNEIQDPVAADGSLIRPQQGDDRYYLWFAYVPSPTAVDPFANYPTCTGGGCNTESVLMFQFHQDGCSGGSPPLAFSLERGGGILDENTWAWALGSIQYPNGPSTYLFTPQAMSPGSWHKFELYVKWSSTCNSGQACAEPPVSPDGRVGFWIDGSNVVPTSTARRTMWDWSECTDNPLGQTGPVGEYMRSGFYGDSREELPATVYLAGYAITTNESAADAVLNGFTP